MPGCSEHASRACRAMVPNRKGRRGVKHAIRRANSLPCLVSGPIAIFGHPNEPRAGNIPWRGTLVRCDHSLVDRIPRGRDDKMSDAVDPSAAAEKLTGLEREFLGLVVAGESTEHITLRLEISEARAREVQQSLKSKLEARTTADLVRAGLVAGL